MKFFASFITGLALAAQLVSCSAPDQPVAQSFSAKDYFFPTDITQIYIYSQDHSSSVTDTFAYQVDAVDRNSSYNSYFKLQRKDSSVLYYFKSEESADGSSICVLSNSTSNNGFVALEGVLDIGASWYTDATDQIQATVVGKYAEYFLPGRQVYYNDVVVVKYSDKNVSPDNYVVRYFARDYGLIFERTITGTSSDVTNLQLLARQGSSNSANPDQHHDRWYNANGRYVANMKTDDLLKK
ncbi:MAG: hypothetical protein ACHQM6_07640 [Candidatus Kapaibacterium sp.]